MKRVSTAVMMSILFAGSMSGAAAQQPGLVHRTAISQGADGAMEITSDAPQVEDDLFKGTEKFAAKAKSVNEVNLDKGMLSSVAKGTGKKADLARKVNYVVIRNYEYAHEGDYDPADVDVFFKRLDGSGWKHIVRTRDGKERTDICVKQNAEGVTTETVIITAEPKELNFIHVSGTLSVNDLQGLGGITSGVGSGDDATPQKN